MDMKQGVKDFGKGLMGGNYKETGATKAGRATGKVVKGATKIAGGFLRRNPFVALGSGLLAAAGLDLAFTENPGFDKEIRYNLPEYMNSEKKDYAKNYKKYWKNALGHDGAPKLEDFSDYNNPEAEFDTAIRIFMDTAPL